MLSLKAPRTANRRFLWTGLVWFIAYLSLSIGVATAKMPHPVELALRRAVVCVAGAAICWLMAFPLERYSRSFTSRLTLAILLSLPASFIYGLVNTWIFLPMDASMPDAMDFVDGIVFVWRIMYFVFVAWAAIYLMIGYEREVQEKDLALSVARNYALEAQNRMLRYQVNPHFLFNILNALSTLVLDGRNETAEQVILALSRFLRHSLEKNPGDRIPLSEELEVQRQYLAIERIRFADRLRVEECVPEALLDARVPSLVLQPLIENCVKYAVAPSTRPVVISIAAESVNGLLRIRVADNGTAASPPNTPRLGIGLGNVRGRLEATYGAAAGLEAAGQPGGGFAVTLMLPLERS